MPIYRSATDRTVSAGRYQFTQSTGVELAELTEEVLEQPLIVATTVQVVGTVGVTPVGFCKLDVNPSGDDVHA